MTSLSLVFIFSFSLSLLSFPFLIKFLVNKQIVDKPGSRKVHNFSKPSIGGIVFLPVALFCVLVIQGFSGISNTDSYLLLALVFIVATGLVDDIFNLRARHKLLFFLPALYCSVFGAEIYLSSFKGLFWINEIGYPLSVLFTLFTLISITNAFNLIDGIDGLAAVVGLLVTSTLGYLIYLQGFYFHSLLLIGVAGCLLAFLKFNWQPSKIFMGDTGSLFLGFLITISLIRFIENSSALTTESITFKNPISFAVALVIIPFVDTMRVFTIRILNGRSPFDPDKNHLHHLLLKMGCGHALASIILVVITSFFVILAFAFRDWSDNTFFYWMFLLGASVCLFLHYLSYEYSFSKKRKLVAQKSNETAYLKESSFTKVKREEVTVS